MQNKIKTLTIEELAKVLHKSPASIRSDIIRNPQSLPPMVRIPHSRRPLFRQIDVEEWLEQQVE